MKISIIIPTYNRDKHLYNCLISILHQKKLPMEVIVVDNARHNKAKKIVNIIKKQFYKKKINIIFIKNKENSGAIARNLGAFHSKGDLIAFLDDDVILDKNYYYEIEKVFIKNKKALGVHGYDTTLEQFKTKLQKSFFLSLVYKFSKLFQISSYFEIKKARVLPSLCVTNPYPGFKSIIQSEWVSTCAGVFSKKVFSKFKFDSKLKKYSWNEYLDFSYSIFLENPKSLFITPNAKYRDVQTEQGRLQLKEQIYMAEVYDAYIFVKKFNLSIKNISIYTWSKFGRMMYNIIKIITYHPKKISIIFHILFAPFYVLYNLAKIRKGNLDFFNKKLS